MTFEKTEIEGVYIITPKVFADSRGYFYESFSEREFEKVLGPVHFCQDNQSKSSYGVVRGLHFQKAPYSQAKLVRCVRGRVLDVAVDLRPGSPTFGKHVSVELSEENHRMFFIPKGMAHGFSVLSPEAVFQYKCDDYYHPEAEDGIQAMDPSLGIDWGVPADKVIMSDKDKVRKNISI
ncbi:MAG: dTDP-4-dehydrorhamnose 3,5-epimerase [Bacteroidales bacterium]|nr:dTDP-4-dehydrorhamnose 3,5-epimerase [Bacteroidales bacterium]